MRFCCKGGRGAVRRSPMKDKWVVEPAAVLATDYAALLGALSILRARLVSPHLFYAGDGKLYRPMTVFAHYYSEPTYHFRIPARSFYPVPKVDGALATFKLRPVLERPKLRSERSYVSFVRQAFSSKRKLVANALRPRWSRAHIEAAMAAVSVDLQARTHSLLQCAVELKRGCCNFCMRCSSRLACCHACSPVQLCVPMQVWLMLTPQWSIATYCAACSVRGHYHLSVTLTGAVLAVAASGPIADRVPGAVRRPVPPGGGGAGGGHQHLLRPAVAALAADTLLACGSSTSLASRLRCVAG